jgi:hypothetical protein
VIASSCSNLRSNLSLLLGSSSGVLLAHAFVISIDFTN